jgi:hypothetical protein
MLLGVLCCVSCPQVQQPVETTRLAPPCDANPCSAVLPPLLPCPQAPHLPGRALSDYLALPLDKYSLLDPKWIARDPSMPGLFHLTVPLQVCVEHCVCVYMCESVCVCVLHKLTPSNSLCLVVELGP